LHLLEPKKNKFLIKTLYGILFILPQGKLYNSLYKRIKHIEVLTSVELKEEKEKNINQAENQNKKNENKK